MSWYSNYIDNISQSNEEYYREYAQEWIDGYFEDSTLVRTIQEEHYPFDNQYDEFEVHIDSVAEITVNVNKVIGDFISIIFKDCSHRNYRGQKYIYNNETYLCYDKVEDLSEIASSKLIRCNNEISWLNSSGQILTEKVWLGYDISSTNDSVTKKGIVSNRRLELYLQYNENTKDIRVNQRFMFQHNQCFRVEELENYNQESGTNGEVTFIKIHLVYSPLLPTDNTELNVCDYGENNYEITISQNTISQIQGFTTTLSAIVLNNGTPIDLPISWESSDTEVVTVDDEGNIEIVGESGETAIIFCYLTNNPSVTDSIGIEVIEESWLPYLDRHITLSPNSVTELFEGDSLEIVAEVWEDGVLTEDEVFCSGSGADSNCYILSPTEKGYLITVNKLSLTPLVLTFSANRCSNVTLTLELNGLF